jgi:uridine kinase
MGQEVMFVIGIAGGTGSGKTTIVSRLARSGLAGQISLLPHDAYYHSGDRMPTHLKHDDNWDHPDALDTQHFVEQVDQLLAGRAVERPVYDFATHSRAPQTVRVEPRPVLLLEGLLLLAVPEVRQRLNLGVYIDTPADLRVTRRVRRDVAERGRTVESVVHQYEHTVRPMHERFVEPSRQYAHLVVPWVFHNEPAIDALLARLRVAADRAG